MIALRVSNAYLFKMKNTCCQRRVSLPVQNIHKCCIVPPPHWLLPEQAVKSALAYWANPCLIAIVIHWLEEFRDSKISLCCPADATNLSSATIQINTTVIFLFCVDGENHALAAKIFSTHGSMLAFKCSRIYRNLIGTILQQHAYVFYRGNATANRKRNIDLMYHPGVVRWWVVVGGGWQVGGGSRNAPFLQPQRCPCSPHHQHLPRTEQLPTGSPASHDKIGAPNRASIFTRGRNTFVSMSVLYLFQPFCCGKVNANDASIPHCTNAQKLSQHYKSHESVSKSSLPVDRFFQQLRQAVTHWNGNGWNGMEWMEWNEWINRKNTPRLLLFHRQSQSRVRWF